MARKQDLGPAGVFVIDKPAGITSHDVVSRFRKLLQRRRIGHGGTLDPFATGLLAVLAGEATKLSPYFTESDKVYRGRIRLGKATNTCDPEGEVIEEQPVPAFDRALLEEIADGFIGEQEQLPPMFSAVKVDGVPLYKHARKGEEVEREAKLITIYRFDILDFDETSVDIEVGCSKGTYVRTLAAEFAEELGTVGHLETLERTSTAGFSMAEAITLDELEALEDPYDHMRPLADALPSLPSLKLNEEQTRKLSHGNEVLYFGPAEEGHNRLFGPGGELVCIADITPATGGAGRLWSLKSVRGFSLKCQQYE